MTKTKTLQNNVSPLKADKMPSKHYKKCKQIFGVPYLQLSLYF